MRPSPFRIDPGLGAPRLDPAHEVHPILAAALGRRLGRPGPRFSEPAAFWSAAHFGLDRAAAFRRAPGEVRQRVLIACSLGLLTEAYFIEKLGLAFTAKMVLLSETSDERRLYSLFAADEATHLSAIEPYLPESAVAGEPDDPFLRLLADAVAGGDKPGLTYLVQVILEGWGISHYQSLARGCLDDGLRRTFRRLLRDEALHHGSGVALLRGRRLPEADEAWALEIVVRLFRMVQAGPQRVVACLEEATGRLSRAERIEAFRQLDAEAQARRRLDQLRALMPASDPILGAVERYGVFRPFSPAECAASSAR